MRWIDRRPAAPAASPCGTTDSARSSVGKLGGTPVRAAAKPARTASTREGASAGRRAASSAKTVAKAAFRAAVSGGRAGKPSIASHRGLISSAGHARDKGNNLADMRTAIDHGVDELEVDVRRTRDGKLVIYHDEKVAHGKHKGRKIADLDRAQLGRLSNGEKVPTLDEVIGLAKDRGVRLQVEIKDEPGDDHGKETAREVAKRLKAGLPRDRFMITSFHVDSIREVERVDRSIKTSLWFTKNTFRKTGNRLLRDSIKDGKANPAFAAKQAKRAGADAVSVGPFAAKDEKFRERIAKEGLDLYVGGVTAKNAAKYANMKGIAGIVTEEPDAVRDARTDAARPAHRRRK
jgi:glycerophosphoryl diester phosphodiesterase